MGPKVKSLEVTESGEVNTGSNADGSGGPALQAAAVSAGALGSSNPNAAAELAKEMTDLLKSLRLKRLGISQVTTWIRQTQAS